MGSRETIGVPSQLIQNTKGETNKLPLPPPTDLYPWLLFCHDKKYHKRRSFYTKTTGKADHSLIIAELHNKRIVGCSHGWLVLSEDQYDHYSLWNPSTFHTITLPPVKPHLNFTVRSCLLSAPPGESNSMVLLFEDESPRILFYRLGSNNKEWTHMKFSKDQFTADNSMDFNGSFALSASCNGLIYLTTRGCDDELLTICIYDKNGNLLVLKPLKITQAKLGKYYYSSTISRYLVESGGQLFSVKIFFLGVKLNQVVAVEVFVLNLGKRQWEKVDSIGDRVFFLGDSCFSCPASSGLDKSCIYFTENEEERYLYSYNVESRRLSVALVFRNLSLQTSSATWVIPITPRLIDVLNEPEDETLNEESQQGETTETSMTVGSDAGDSKEVMMLPLMRDVLAEVAKLLNLLDYMNFRIVCKAFLRAAPAIKWRTTSPAATHSLSPWLVFTGGKDRNVFTFIEPELNGRYHIRIPNELQGTDIRYSRDGWLLMSRNQEDSMFYFNPFTKNVLPCPYFSPGDHVSNFMFLSTPTSADCFTAEFRYLRQEIGIHYYLKHNDRYTRFDSEDFVPNPNTPPVCLEDGAFYFLGQEGDLLKLSYYPRIVVKTPSPCDSFQQNFLVEYGDEDLLSIFIGVAEKWVRVFKLDRSSAQQHWKEVYSLGNRTVYLSPSRAFSVVAKSKGMDNRIYFPRLYNESLVFYSLTTQQFHYSGGGDDSLKGFSNTEEQLLSAWIEPSWV